jgi:uncharacterized Zn finger protein (UPF0148 family)
MESCFQQALKANNKDRWGNLICVQCNTVLFNQNFVDGVIFCGQCEELDEKWRPFPKTEDITEYKIKEYRI